MKWHILPLAAMAVVTACDQVTSPTEPVRTPPSLQATTEHTSFTVPLGDQINPCNGEYVVIDGTATFRTTTISDGHGGFHIYASATFVGKGIGLFGNEYTFSEVGTFDFYADQPFPNVFTGTQLIHLIGKGDAPNYTQTLLLHFTTNNNGVTTVSIENLRTKCSA
jgi:hypothetical protein